MNTNLKNLLSLALVFAFLFTAIDADAQKRRKKKKRKKKSKIEKVAKKLPPIIETDTSKVCKVYTSATPDKAAISQNFADMNLRRQAKDFGPGEYSAYDYWQKVYQEAPGLSLLVYTDGSAIFREMAAKAQQDGDDAKFKEYGDKALELLEKAEKCYPENKGKLDAPKAYIYELLYPEETGKILELYTANLGENTDAYSLGSIARYAKYMAYINEIPLAEANKYVEKAKAIALAKKGNHNYDYALETIDAIEKQYAEYEVANKAQEEYEKKKAEYDAAMAAKKEQEASATKQAQQATQAAASQSDKRIDAYNSMLGAIESKDWTTAKAQYQAYKSLEKDANAKYNAAIYLGTSLYSAENFPEARNYLNDAITAMPSKGEPHYYIGMMYVSSGPLCGPGTGFDSQRVVYPGLDRLEKAISLGLSAEMNADAVKTIAAYKPFLPTAAQLKAKGLAKGQTYTVPCWINETITLR